MSYPGINDGYVEKVVVRQQVVREDKREVER